MRVSESPNTPMKSLSNIQPSIQKQAMLVRQLEEELRMRMRQPNLEMQQQMEAIYAENEHLQRELSILRETIKELECRCETHKQTLIARDESIKKLLEMLQAKGMGEWFLYSILFNVIYVPFVWQTINSLVNRERESFLCECGELFKLRKNYIWMEKKVIGCARCNVFLHPTILPCHVMNDKDNNGAAWHGRQAKQRTNERRCSLLLFRSSLLCGLE